MGTKMGPNYANLVGFVEKQIFEQYTDPIPDYLGRWYIDDCVGTASCSRGELECFINYVNNLTNVTDQNRTPLVLTFHPFNFKVRDVIRKNFHILKNDPETSSIFSNNPLLSLLDTAKISAKP